MQGEIIGGSVFGLEKCILESDMLVTLVSCKMGKLIKL